MRLEGVLLDEHGVVVLARLHPASRTALSGTGRKRISSK